MNIEKNKDEKVPPGLGRTPREIYDEEERARQDQSRLRREEQLQDQSLREGMRFLFKSIVQFVFYVVIGAFVVFLGQDFMATHYPGGVLMVVAGAGLILKGMISLGGFNSK